VIVWDERKNAANRKKHGISFETAQLVFEDPLHRTIQERVEEGEVRYQTLGQIGGIALVLNVAHTWSDDEGEEIIRIISARRATKAERKNYERAK
jgi:uncharacterized DUF497 family protein